MSPKSLRRLGVCNHAVDFLILILFFSLAPWNLSELNADELSAKLLDGERYEVETTDTLDLAERGRLSVNALTRFLCKEADYSPYGHAFFHRNPAYLSSVARGTPNWGKIAQSLVLTRLMSGSEQNRSVDEPMLHGMLERVKLNPAAPTPVSRVMLALIDLYEINPTEELHGHINRMADQHVDAAQHDHRGAYYSDSEYLGDDTHIGVLGDWLPVFVNGCAIRSLVRWGKMEKNPKYLQLASELGRFLRQPRYWSPEAMPKAIVPTDRGRFQGHQHSYAQAMLGLLEVANLEGDSDLLEHVRAGYEYQRDFGIAPVGLLGEACLVGDMTILAIRLTDVGVGDYWDDVDRYVRNHLVEMQITDSEKLQHVIDQSPNGRSDIDMNSGPLEQLRAGPGGSITGAQELNPHANPLDDSTEDVVQRNVGAFLSDASRPSLIPSQSLMYNICCTGNCNPALFWAWEGIVREDGQGVEVNLLLNRASPWLDVHSSLPHEGRVRLDIKTARHVSIRIPQWLRMNDVSITRNDQESSVARAGRYFVISNLEAGDEIDIEFPLIERKEIYSLKWKQNDFWQESNNPGADWTAPSPAPEVTFTFRGATVVDVTPRETGVGYALYARNNFQSPKTPLHRVQRFVPAKLPQYQR